MTLKHENIFLLFFIFLPKNINSMKQGLESTKTIFAAKKQIQSKTGYFLTSAEQSFGSKPIDYRC